MYGLHCKKQYKVSVPLYQKSPAKGVAGETGRQILKDGGWRLSQRRLSQAMTTALSTPPATLSNWRIRKLSIPDETNELLKAKVVSMPAEKSNKRFMTILHIKWQKHCVSIY